MEDNEATFDMFMKGLSYWRECSGSTKYSWEQMDSIFNGLTHTYITVRVNLKLQSELDKLDSIFWATSDEHGRRQAHRLVMPLREVIHGKQVEAPNER